MPEFTYEIKVPKDRIAVLIGKKGEIKKQIEEATNTKLNIDSNEGEVFVAGADALNLFITKDVIRAIGRGFNPEIALLLLKQDFSFEILNIADFAKNRDQIPRLKGRVIGMEGKSRRLIEELTETHISVYGKTVGIIGRAENVAIARRAVESLLAGSPHANVYRWLEKTRKDLKEKGIGEMWNTSG